MLFFNCSCLIAFTKDDGNIAAVRNIWKLLPFFIIRTARTMRCVWSWREEIEKRFTSIETFIWRRQKIFNFQLFYKSAELYRCSFATYALRAFRLYPPNSKKRWECEKRSFLCFNQSIKNNWSFLVGKKPWTCLRYIFLKCLYIYSALSWWT